MFRTIVLKPWRLAAVIISLLAVLSGCGRLVPEMLPTGAPADRPEQSEPAQPPEQAAAKPAPQPVPAAEVTALVDRLSQGGWTLTWEEPSKTGKAGLSTRSDRFYQPSEGQGFVQLGLVSWSMFVDKNGRIEWEGPFAGAPPQLPFLNKLQARPDWWGAATLLAGAQALNRHPQPDGLERWAAVLDPAGTEVTWHGWPATMTGLELVIKDALPLSFTAQMAGEKGPQTIQGRYTWEDPVLQAPTQSNHYLGLFGVWLGETRDDLEPIRLVPAKREREVDGSEWVYASHGRSIKYDPTGKVVTLVRTEGGLLNGLSVGDEKARVLHFFPQAVETSPGILTQHYPDGARLEIPVYGGQVFGFWAVAAGH